MADDGLFLGGTLDAAGAPTSPELRFDAADLTTHAVIVGMTGSGKTGLGVVLLEEVLRTGVPALILDPKGDMTNLLLGFPDLAPGDFEPWIDPGEVRSAGSDPATVAAEKAAQWRDGLASWGLDGSDIADLHRKAGFTVYTPGSGAGVRLDIVGSLANPGLDWDTEAETLREQIQGFASGLLGLVGIAADPISSREHILIANLVEHGWRSGADLDLATLVAQVQRPPMRKLGVFEVDTFFPEKDRHALAMRLNALLASPSFAEWVQGVPLDVAGLLWDAAGTPQAAVVYLAHLSDEERQFIVTLLLSEVVTWMRGQPGTSDLRAVVYMDEVFGFAPPTAEPPAKRPILTLLKQARAYGVGVVLATQNPVDLDYKAMSNAATWFVGRLQTERDKARIVEALRSVGGDRDVAELDRTVTGLAKRQFLLQSAHLAEPVLFSTRWALSYLAGPLTREQLTRLRREAPHEAATAEGGEAPEETAPDTAPEARHAPAPAATDATEDDETVVMPAVADGVPVRFLDTAAPWAAEVDADPAPTVWDPFVAARTRLVFDDRTAGIDHAEEWETVIPLSDGFDPGTGIAVDYDDRDLLAEPPASAAFRIVDARIDTASFWRDARTRLVDHLTRTRTVVVPVNRTLKLFGRPGESAAEFAARCDTAAQAAADEETAKLRGKYETKLAAARKRFDAADRRVSELEADVGSARQGELLEGAGTLLGMLTGRSGSRSLGTSAVRRRQATQRSEARLRTAQDKASDEREAMAALDDELGAEVAEIDTRWRAAAGEVEDLAIGLERSDVTVDELVLLWVPRRR